MKTNDCTNVLLKESLSYFQIRSHSALKYLPIEDKHFNSVKFEFT